MRTEYFTLAEPALRRDDDGFSYRVPVEPVSLVMDNDPPMDPMNWPGRMEFDARRLADYLVASLPGGTIDRLTYYLVERMIGDMVVPHSAVTNRRHGGADSAGPKTGQVRD